MTTGYLDLDLGDYTPGRVEVATAKALDAATAAGELTDVHAAAATAALNLARGMDEAEAHHQGRARAECSKELRLVLASLGLDRKSRGELEPAPPPPPAEVVTPPDPFDELTRAMSATVSDTPTP